MPGLSAAIAASAIYDRVGTLGRDVSHALTVVALLGGRGVLFWAVVGLVAGLLAVVAQSLV